MRARSRENEAAAQLSAEWLRRLLRGPALPLLAVGLGAVVRAPHREAAPAPSFGSLPEVGRAAQREAAQETFERANALYLRGDYAGAEALYREVLSELPESLAARYNLGNALYRQGRLGEALQQYLAVLHRAPRDSLARNNVVAVRQRLAADLALDEGMLVAGPPAPPLGWLSSEEIAWITLGALYLAMLLCALALIRRAPRRMAASGAALILLAAAALHTAALRARWSRPEALVVGPGVLARESPSSERPVVLRLPEGAPLHVGRESGGWAFVSLPNGLSGWVPREHIGLIP